MANEKRLIDANALIENSDVFTMHTKEYGSIEVIPVDAIGDAPTVDAVEVVRCKDCKHWKCWRSSGEGSGDCLLDEGYQTLATQHYDFCSYGERREGE